MARGKPLSLRRAIDAGYNKRTAALVWARRRHLRAVGTKASLTTALTGTNNDLTITAVQPGADGNQITVQYVNAGGTTPLSLAWTSNSGPARAIVITLATTTGTITSTAAQVRDLINGSARVQNHVQAANAAANDGTGLVTVMAATPLAGGTG